MLFNSYIFLFAFLPLTLIAVWLSRRYSRNAAIVTLIVASTIFYSWLVPAHLFLLLGSALFNYVVALRICSSQKYADEYLWLGVTANLLLLGVFKYLDFLIGTVNSSLSTEWTLTHILLPLGVSFFTFQQIAFLVDARRGEADVPTLPEYLLFVSFFPQLIAGPIVHHREILPQLRSERFAVLTSRTMVLGLTWLAIGLAKKTLIADQIAQISDTTFGAASLADATPSFFEAWFGVLAFAFQIYFDFSAYSDMAIGLGIMFGVLLPLNFAAPYRATSIIEFWQRWHMTLSRFLRDYLYFALGGNRKGAFRRYTNLMTTMVLGGLWHGAAFTFVIWGALHGAYLMVNHAWRRLGFPLPAFVGWVLTMAAVCFAWTLFRAEDLDTAIRMIEGMVGLNGVKLAQNHFDLIGPLGAPLASVGVVFEGPSVVRLTHFPLFFGLIVFVLIAPTTQRLLSWSSLEKPVLWQMGVPAGLAAGVLLGIAILGIGDASQFIYFQF